MRVPADLKDFIEREAEKNGRSINAEIVTRLKDGVAISATIRGELQHWASLSRKSLEAEIQSRLEASLDKARQEANATAPTEPAEIIDWMIERLAATERQLLEMRREVAFNSRLKDIPS